MDRKKVAQQLREEAAQLIKAADLLDGAVSSSLKPKRVVSEETKQKMREAHQRRIAAKSAPAKKPGRRPARKAARKKAAAAE